MKRSIFKVKFRNKPANLSCSIVAAWPASASVDWTNYVSNLLPQLRTQKVRDSLEYLFSSAEKWKNFASQARVFKTLHELKTVARGQPRAELLGAIAAEADWYPLGRIVGFALFRRTWCNHLAIDFLAAHPRLCGPEKDITGVGTSLLGAIGHLAQEIRAEKLWLETTADSVEYYRELFLRPELEDVLVIDRKDFIERVSKIRVSQ